MEVNDVSSDSLGVGDASQNVGSLWQFKKGITRNKGLFIPMATKTILMWLWMWPRHRSTQTLLLRLLILNPFSKVLLQKEVEEFQSDTKDSGSVDDDPNDCGPCSNNDDLVVNQEIPIQENLGEVWLLGLMEGEYSDLRIEEKLNALVALTELLLSGSSIRVEDPTQAIAECVPNIHLYGSGAKLKGSSTKRHGIDRPSWGYAGQIHSTIDAGFSWALVVHRIQDIGGLL